MPKPTREQVLAVLCGLYIACGGSVHCHKRPETIRKKTFTKIGTKTVKKALEILRAEGLVQRYGGTDSYYLTKDGAGLARMVCVDLIEEA